jgi:hypothetical protein
VPKIALSASTEFGQQILRRVGSGQSPEDVAIQMGRKPQTIRNWLASAGQRAAGQSRWSELARRTVAFGNELIASLFSWRESRYAAQTSRELLKLYWIVRASHPGLPRQEIYKRVVMARTGADFADAETLLRRADESFASWPADRALTFSDVVHYMAVSEFLAASDSRMGTRINMGRLVAGRIPADL